MDFFLDVGIYVLIVVLAAAGAGFIMFRLLTAGGGTARGAASRRSRAESSERDEDAGGDDWVAPTRAAQPDTSSTGKRPAPSRATVVSAGSGGAPSARAAQAATKGDSDTVAALESLEMALSKEAQPDGVKTAGAGQDENVVPPTTPLEPAVSETVQSVIAPPDEVAEGAPEDDSILSMFQGDDADESTVGDLANRLEDVEASFLLATAIEIVSTRAKAGRGGSNA